MQTAFQDCNERRHPQIVMKELGITYDEGVPQSICDQWWFFNCSNLPKVLPLFLTELVLSQEERMHWLAG